MSNIATLGLGSIPRITNWEYATAAARTAATGFVASDIGKFAKQTDDGSIWELTAVTPTWALVGGSGASRAITVEVIDYGGGSFSLRITIVDENGADVTDEYFVFDVWLSDDNITGALTTTAPDTDFSVNTGTLLHTYIASKFFKVLSDTREVIIDLEESTAGTWYLWVSWANGVSISDVITV